MTKFWSLFLNHWDIKGKINSWFLEMVKDLKISLERIASEKRIHAGNKEKIQRIFAEKRGMIQVDFEWGRKD